MDTGRTRITGGPGSATKISGGPRITTVAGPTSRTTAGFGCPEPTSVGDRRGYRGELVAITSVGRLRRRADLAVGADCQLHDEHCERDKHLRQKQRRLQLRPGLRSCE